MSSMEVITVSEIAAKWGVSERSVRNYCASGRVPGAFLVGKTWNIPATATKPERKIRASKNSSLLTVLRDEMQSGRKGGIYHHIQIEMTYNSNHIEGSCLSHEATRYIFETNTIGITKDKAINVDDVIETVNHFRCIDMVIRNAEKTLSETMIKKLHLILKSGTRDSNKSWFKVGDYKKIPNEVGGIETTEPENVASELKALLKEHNEKPEKTFDDLLDFHDFFFRDWGRLSAVADKTSDARRVADDVPSFVGEFHVNQYVPLENLAVDHFALAVFNFNLLFFGDDRLKDFAFHLN